MPEFLTTSPRSYPVGCVVLFLLPFLALGFGHPFRSTLALWTGVVVGLVIAWISTPQLAQDSNMWPIDLLFLALCAGIPVWAGGLVVYGIQKERGNPAQAIAKRSRSSD